MNAKEIRERRDAIDLDKTNQAFDIINQYYILIDDILRDMDSQEKLDGCHALHEARRALHCLHIAVEESIAKDVQDKVEAAFAALRQQQTRWIPVKEERMNDADKNTIKFVMHKCTGGYEICTGDALELLEIIDRLEAENARLKAQMEKLRVALMIHTPHENKCFIDLLLAETEDAK